MLDFSALNNDVPKCPPRRLNEPGNINIPAELKTTPAAVQGPKAKADRKKATDLTLLELGRIINERLGRAEITIAEYHKAIKKNRPPEEIALLAAKALSLAVSEDLIFKSLEKHYQDLGVTVSAEPPYKIIYTEKYGFTGGGK